MKPLLLILSTIACMTISCNAETMSDKEFNWFPIYSYHNDHIKLYVDNSSLVTSEIQGAMVSTGTILIVPDEAAEIETRSNSSEASKVRSFRSVIAVIGIDCKTMVMLTIANLYFESARPTSISVPITMYEFPQIKESLISVDSSNFIYKTMCAVSA